MLKVIGKIDLSEFDKPYKSTDENVLIIRDMRTAEELLSSEDLEEYDEIMHHRQMCHWLQLGINKELTDAYFDMN